MSRGVATISAERPRALRRMVLPAIGGVLALLAPWVHALGQTPQAGVGPKLRILSVSTPPLAEEQLPEGGLLLALVNASLNRAGGPAPKIEVRWTTGALTQQLLTDTSLDLYLPVEGADCERPNDLTQASAVVCDHSVFSEPVLQVVLGLFSLSNSTFKFDRDESVLGKTLCLSRELDLTALNANGRYWASYKRVTVLRRATLLDCVVAVQAHDADAFVAIDLEGTHLLRRLGLTPYFAMQARPLATRSVHAVVSREHPRGAEILVALNQGLKRLKEGDAYSAIIQKHLMAAASPVAVASRLATPPAQAVSLQPASPPGKPAQVAVASPAGKPAQVAVAPPPGKSPQGLAPQGAPPPGAPPLAAPPPAPNKAAGLPVLDQASRATALKFMKRGDEELSEGRVAPARLLYERAAEMGLAQAAMALAGTFDAVELSKPHLRNVVPDSAEAKRWYERARALGAADANARLQRLGAN